MSTNVQWLLGAFLVFVYAQSRFNTPPSNRSSTTNGRYYFAAFSYLLALSLLFILLGGALTEFPDIMVLLNSGANGSKDIPKELPGPLLATLLLTTLLPNSPILMNIDERFRRFFQEMGNIPWGAGRLSGKMRRVAVQVPAGLHEDIRHQLPDFNQASIRFEADDTVEHFWTKLTSLYVQIKAWPDLKNYDRFVASSSEDFKRIQTTYERLRPRALKCFTLACSAQGDRADPVTECLNHLQEQLEDFFRQISEFIARGVLRCELTRKGREERLKDMGFVHLARESDPLTANQTVTIGMAAFLIILTGMLLGPLLLQVEGGQRPAAHRALLIAAMVGTIYAVSIVASIHPKTTWSFANIKKTGQAPTLAYLLSGCIAVALGLIVSITFKFLYHQSFVTALRDLQVTYPFFLLAFVLAFTTAVLADDYSLREEAEPRWLRWLEGAILAAVMAAASALVFLMLSGIENVADREIPVPRPPLGVLIGNGCLIGFSVGAWVPHWYRTTPQEVERLA